MQQQQQQPQQLRSRLTLNIIGAAVAIAVGLTTAGCQQDSVSVSNQDGTAFDNTLTIGEKADVTVRVDHPEIEGSTDFAAISIVSSDTTIVRTEHGGQGGFLLFGVAKGTARLHVETDSYADADFVVTVQ